MKYDNYMNIEELKQTEGAKYCPTRATYFTRRTTYFARSATYLDKTSHRITKEEKSGKIVANQGIGMETAE